MKIRFFSIIIAFAAIFWSCSEQMEYNEFSDFSNDEVFTSFNRTLNFVTNIYGYIDYDFGLDYSGAMLASATDEAEYVWSFSDIHDFYNGGWSAINAKSYLWTTCYQGIRASNYFLKASVGQTFDQFRYNTDYNDQIQRFNRYQYEVRFLRAYFYFNLVRQYGDIPFYTDVLTEAEANTLSRRPANEIFDFIVSECNAIADNLPASYNAYSSLPYSETGRATKGAVLALKARALLYKASPLFNQSNNALWRDAARASKDVIDFCAANNLVLGTYATLWGESNFSSTEMLFIRRIGDLRSLEQYNFPIGVEGGRSGNCPTQNMVDAYEMLATGKR